jgi:hypothetical protein
MKKLSVLLLCALSALAGEAQTNVSVFNFKATPGTSATTATFSVSWTSAGNDSVWVFVDYNTAGTMKRLPLTTATVSAGTVRSPNKWGAWVVAPADGGDFSATVTLSSGTTYSYGSCAYAISRPPKALYTAYNTVAFTGTPPFELEFEGSSSVSVPAAIYTIPAGSTLASVTDATRAPGIINCKEPDTQELSPSAAGYCWDSPGVQLTLRSTDEGAVYGLYKNHSAQPAATLTGTGRAETFGGHFTAGAYTVRVEETDAFCPLAMDGALPVVNYLTAGVGRLGSTTCGSAGVIGTTNL